MMRKVDDPPRQEWPGLCSRPVLQREALQDTVSELMDRVAIEGDEALLQLTRKFDAPDLNELWVSERELDSGAKQVSPVLQQSIQLAYENIYRFHQTQLEQPVKVQTMEGVNCWRRSVPIQSVGLYVPGGSAPLFSSLLMLGVPAKIARCPQVIIATPPRPDGTIAPEILFTAKLLGFDRLLKAGGAQAIAAMTFGTATVPRVNKLFGPGNQYVTAAKMQALQQGVAIDMPAGPSEVLVVADDSCEPDFVAADLLAQAEHGPDSQVVLLTDSETVREAVLEAVKQQLDELPRKETAATALSNSLAICFSDLNSAMAFSNVYAPEHLILAVDNAAEMSEQVTQAGSVFLGHLSCESAGDYASGTNHTLPTNGYAAAYSGVSVDSFVKKITFQELDKNGVANIGPAVAAMATAEGLNAHANAMLLRMKKLGHV